MGVGFNLVGGIGAGAMEMRSGVIRSCEKKFFWLVGKGENSVGALGADDERKVVSGGEAVGKNRVGEGKEAVDQVGL